MITMEAAANVRRLLAGSRLPLAGPDGSASKLASPRYRGLKTPRRQNRLYCAATIRYRWVVPYSLRPFCRPRLNTVVIVRIPE